MLLEIFLNLGEKKNMSLVISIRESICYKIFSKKKWLEKKYAINYLKN